MIIQTVHPRREPKRRVIVSSADSGSTDSDVTVTTSDGEAPVSLRGLLIFSVLISISNYVVLAFLDIARSALFPLFFAMPVAIGGLGLSPPTIGYILGAYGFSSGLFQVRYFARIVRRFGPKRVFCAGMISFLPIFALFPTMSTIARRFGSSPVIWVLLVLQLALSVVMDMSYGEHIVSIMIDSLTNVYPKAVSSYISRLQRRINALSGLRTGLSPKTSVRMTSKLSPTGLLKRR